MRAMHACSMGMLRKVHIALPESVNRNVFFRRWCVNWVLKGSGEISPSLGGG